MMGTSSNVNRAHLVLCSQAKALGTVRPMANNLKRLRTERELSQTELADRMNTTRNQIAKLESGARRLSDVWISRAAVALRVDPGALVADSMLVDVVGYVGAGSMITYYGEDEGSLETVDRPPGASDETVAVRVKGDSMPGVAEDRWILYYDKRVRSVPDEWVNQLCVVWLPNERVYVKKVYRGRDPGTFDLISTGHYEPMRDEEVEWSAKVQWIKPA